MIIFCADAGIANFGYAVVRVDTVVTCLAAGVIRTEKSDKKRGVLATADTTRRVRELAHALDGLISNHRPQLLCCESMSFPRSASCAAKLGMARATLDTIAELRGLPVLQASPQEVKKYLCGKASASKDDVADEVKRRIYGDPLSLLQQGGLPRGVHEHAFDAMAVGLCALQSDIVRALRAAA